jgi:hypothetical protein
MKILFKLEEEKPALLLLYQAGFAETPVFVSAFGFGCWLVVGFFRSRTHKTANQNCSV